MRTGVIALAGLALIVAACGETRGQRAGTGAAGGAIIGGVAAGPIGALVGAGVGAAGGAYREEAQDITDPAVDRQTTRLTEAVQGQAQAAQAERPRETAAVSTPARPEQQAALPSGDDLTNEEVREAQTALRDMGLFEGDVDGMYGRQTIRAVGEFQEQENLPRTRALDDRTQQELQSAAAREPAREQQQEQAPQRQQQEPGAAPSGTPKMEETPPPPQTQPEETAPPGAPPRPTQ